QGLSFARSSRASSGWRGTRPEPESGTGVRELSRGRRGAGVVAQHDGSAQTRGSKGPAQAPAFGRMTVVDVLGRVDERADGTGGSVDAVTGAAIGPYRKSRFDNPHRSGGLAG